MKLLGLLLLISCSTLNVADYPHSISKIQTCWSQGKVSCIEKEFGKPDDKTNDFISYQKQTLRIWRKSDQIKTIAYWMLDPQYANLKSIQRLLPSDDWKVEMLPEKNPHVVEFAEANYSKKLGVSFLTYKQDPEKKVRILYWGGDYKDIQF